MLFMVLFALTMWIVIVLPLYLYTNHREEQLNRFGVTTSGTVISAERACSGDECQSVRVAYPVEGNEYQLEANTDPNHPRSDAGLTVGQSVEVRYNPANPERVRLLTLGASDAGFFRFMTFFGLILLGLPAAFLVVKRLFNLPTRYRKHPSPTHLRSGPEGRPRATMLTTCRRAERCSSRIPCRPSRSSPGSDYSR